MGKTPDTQAISQVIIYEMRNNNSDNHGEGGSPFGKTRLDIRLLVAEDDADLRRITAGILNKAGFDVDTAEDGEAAWKLLQRHEYALIVTDYNMPKVTGIDLIRQLHSAHIKTPVILMTGNLPNDALRRNPDLQIEAIIIKPYSEQNLLSVVNNVLHGLVMNGVTGTQNPKQSGSHPGR